MECVKEPTNNLWKLFRIMVYEMVLPKENMQIPKPEYVYHKKIYSENQMSE